MAFNGSGIFQRLYSWVADAAAGLNVDATRMDEDTDDIAAGLSNCITRDGQGTPTTDIPWSNHKITSLADGSAPGDAVNYSQLQSAVNETIVSLSAGSNTLTNSSVGKLHIAQSSTAVTSVTLPLLSAVTAGNKIRILNLYSSAITIQRQGTDTITAVSGSGTITSVSLKPGQNIELVYQGGSWTITGGSAALSTASATGPFGFLSAANGYIWLNGGILVQWLTASAAGPGSYTDNAYPIPFPNAFYSASATHYGSTETANVVIHNNSPNEKSYIRLESSNSTGSTVFVIAIGS